MFTRPKTCILLALAASSFLSNARADTIDAIDAFGDSLSDAGNISLLTGGTIPGAPYANGRFSNGSVWVQNLATELGLAPIWPSLAGGTDYAYGDAQSGATLFNPVASPIDLNSQVAQFESANPAGADPKSLYTIWIGGNDLSAIPADATLPQIAVDIGQIVSNIDTSIATLAGLGAKNFLVVTVPDLGKTPAGSVAPAVLSAISAGFDSALVSSLAGHPGISFLDTYSLLDTIVANPGAFGLTDVTNPCYTGTYAGFADILDPGTVCSDPDKSLFWDQTHPTAAGQQIIANAALSVITPEPNSMALVGGVLGLLFLRRRYRASNQCRVR